jgi:hypothetical protein
MLLACADSREQNIVSSMLGPLARCLAATLAASVAAACTQDNPWFVPLGSDDATSAASNSTSNNTSTSTSTSTSTGSESSATMTGSGSDSDSSARPTTSTSEPGTTTSSSTDPIDTSTGEPPPDSSTGEPDTSTGAVDTGQPVAEVQNVIASLATCVLLPLLELQLLYIGPVGCEMAAELNANVGEIGVMVLDTAFLPAANRESRVYLSFDVPAAPPGKVLTYAALSIQTSASPNAGASWSGDLYLSDPFTELTLKTVAPAGILLALDPGSSAPNQPSLWEIPTDAIIASETLYLGLAAQDTDGVLYRSSRAADDKKPRLHLTYE